MGRKSTNKARSSNDQKRNKWVRQLYPFFKNRGLLGFSMEEVAGYLDVSKATIYNYFKSKEEIISCYMAEKFTDFSAFDDKLDDLSKTFVDRYEDALFHLVQEMSDFSPQVRSDLEHIFPELWKNLNSVIDEYLSQVRKHYEIGIETGVYEKFNPSILLLCDKNMLFYMSDSEQLAESGVSLSQAFAEYMFVRKNGMLLSS
jgi:AcrR family transcriptional regulator